MKIVLKSLTLVNFMGIRSKTVQLNEHMQSIYGANETGKSTLFNAFLWLLFGKDMEGRKDYKVKTTDATGKEIQKLDHEVQGVFDIDGREITAKRILKEKWPTPRGAAEPVFAGNETEFYWNDVPLKEKEYQDKIGGIVKENVFKLITNPLYFNTGITWQERRNMLMEIAGEIRDEDIAHGNEKFIDLLKKLVGKSLPEFKKEIAAKKRKIRDVQEAIPARIDEANRSMPSELPNFPAIKKAVLAKEAEIAQVDGELQNSADAQKEKNNTNLARQNDIYTHKQEIQRIESGIRAQFVEDKNNREINIRSLRADGRSRDSELASQKNYLTILERTKGTLEKQMADLRADWTKTNGNEPPKATDDFTCPTCKQTLPDGTIEQRKEAQHLAIKTFQDNKAKRLAEITATGQERKGEHTNNEALIAKTREAIADLEKSTEEIRTRIASEEAESLKLNGQADQATAESISANAKIKDLTTRIAGIEAAIITSNATTPDNSELTTRKHVLRADLDALKQQLGMEEQIKRTNARIQELDREAKELGQQIADLDSLEFTIMEFTRAKIETLESRINHLFKYAKFKLFEIQVNGQEVECCETMYKGVVFGAMNTAARVQVGIDIINVLSNHFDVKAPVFLDNRESVTAIPDTDAQIINLIVSPEDKQLRVA